MPTEKAWNCRLSPSDGLLRCQIGELTLRDAPGPIAPILLDVKAIWVHATRLDIGRISGEDRVRERHVKVAEDL